MIEISQEIVALLHIQQLLLKVILGMIVDNLFRSIDTIYTENYQWNNDLGNFITTRVDNQLKDIDRNWIRHTEEYTTRNKHYKDEDHGGYTINIEPFDIDGALRRQRIMKYRNESLNNMGLHHNFDD